MTIKEIEKEFYSLSQLQIINNGCEKQFFTEVYGHNDSFFNWLLTAFGPTIGFSFAGLLSVLGVNIATVSVGGLLGLFGVTALNPVLLVPFLVAALGTSIGGIVISRKKNKIKDNSSSPQDILFLTIITKIYLPFLRFLEIGSFDKSKESLEGKIKEQLSKFGLRDQFINEYLYFINKIVKNDFETFVEFFIDFVTQLKNKIPGQGKLYKKDFKEDILNKKSLDFANLFNNEFCTSITDKENNKQAIEKVFDYFENTTLEIENKYKQNKENEKNQKREIKKKISKENKLNKVHFKYFKSLAKHESTREKALLDIQILAELGYEPAKKYQKIHRKELPTL